MSLDAVRRGAVRTLVYVQYVALIPSHRRICDEVKTLFRDVHTGQAWSIGTYFSIPCVRGLARTSRELLNFGRGRGRLPAADIISLVTSQLIKNKAMEDGFPNYSLLHNVNFVRVDKR